MGWTVEQVADQLKLAVRQVVALEQGDYANLPGPAVVRGFVRAYAKVVKLDAAPLVAEIRGDILLLQGQRDAAAKAYATADAALAKRDEARPVLDLKLAEVGLTPAKRASDVATEAFAEVQP